MRNPPELIHRIDIGKCARDRAKPPIFASVDHPVLAPVAAPADQLESPAIQRVERMRDPHLGTGRTDTACS